MRKIKKQKEDEEMNKAATKIGEAYRGKRARRDVAKLKADKKVKLKKKEESPTTDETPQEVPKKVEPKVVPKIEKKELLVPGIISATNEPEKLNKHQVKAVHKHIPQKKKVVKAQPQV